MSQDAVFLVDEARGLIALRTSSDFPSTLSSSRVLRPFRIDQTHR